MPVQDYDRAAAIYDPLLNPFLDSLRQEVVCQLVNADASRVLDLCCGTGRQAILLHEAGMTVTGVDLSGPMLAVAQRNSPPAITYHLADATNTNLPGADFDAVLLSFALHELEEPLRQDILAEAKRLCSPTGQIMILDYRRPDTLLGKTTLAPITLVERLAGKEHHANFKHYMREGATAGLLDRAGLTGTLLAAPLRGCAGIYSIPL